MNATPAPEASGTDAPHGPLAVEQAVVPRQHTGPYDPLPTPGPAAPAGHAAPSSGAPEDHLDDPDPRRAADLAATENLLRCWVRERNLPAPASATLRVPLDASGTALQVPVIHWSLTGWHRFGAPALEGLPATAPPVDAVTVAALLGRETGRSEGTELVGRVADSVLRTAEFITARRRRPNPGPESDLFLTAEQSLLLGHPLHPTPKSREGLSETETHRYSPELHGSFPCTGPPSTAPSWSPTPPGPNRGVPSPPNNSPPASPRASRSPRAPCPCPSTPGRPVNCSTARPSPPSSTPDSSTTWGPTEPLAPHLLGPYRAPAGLPRHAQALPRRPHHQLPPREPPQGTPPWRGGAPAAPHRPRRPVAGGPPRLRHRPRPRLARGRHPGRRPGPRTRRHDPSQPLRRRGRRRLRRGPHGPAPLARRDPDAFPPRRPRHPARRPHRPAHRGRLRRVVPPLSRPGRPSRPLARRHRRRRPGGPPAEHPGAPLPGGLAHRRPVPGQPGLLLPGVPPRRAGEASPRHRGRQRHLRLRPGHRRALRLLPGHQQRPGPDRRLRRPGPRRRAHPARRLPAVPRLRHRSRLPSPAPPARSRDAALQGQPPDPRTRPRRACRPRRHPVRLRHHHQPLRS